jgi:hypothetical protein
MNDELKKDLEKKGAWPLLRQSPDMRLDGRRETANMVIIIGVPTDIRREQLPGTSLNGYCLRQLTPSALRFPYLKFVTYNKQERSWAPWRPLVTICIQLVSSIKTA